MVVNGGCKRCHGDEKLDWTKQDGTRWTTRWFVPQASWWDNIECRDDDEMQWGMSWWRRWDWSEWDWDWQRSAGAVGSSDPPPPEPTAEPTASSTPLATMDSAYPTKDHGEDLTALRAATTTQALENAAAARDDGVGKASGGTLWDLRVVGGVV